MYKFLLQFVSQQCKSSEFIKTQGLQGHNRVAPEGPKEKNMRGRNFVLFVCIAMAFAGFAYADETVAVFEDVPQNQCRVNVDPVLKNVATLEDLISKLAASPMAQRRWVKAHPWLKGHVVEWLRENAAVTTPTELITGMMFGLTSDGFCSFSDAVVYRKEDGMILARLACANPVHTEQRVFVEKPAVPVQGGDVNLDVTLIDARQDNRRTTHVHPTTTIYETRKVSVGVYGFVSSIPDGKASTNSADARGDWSVRYDNILHVWTVDANVDRPSEGTGWNCTIYLGTAEGGVIQSVSDWQASFPVTSPGEYIISARINGSVNGLDVPISMTSGLVTFSTDQSGVLRGTFSGVGFAGEAPEAHGSYGLGLGLRLSLNLDKRGRHELFGELEALFDVEEADLFSVGAGVGYRFARTLDLSARYDSELGFGAAVGVDVALSRRFTLFARGDYYAGNDNYDDTFRGLLGLRVNLSSIN